MYHMKKDQRVKKSAECIYRGLSQCLEKKDITDITINDIQKTSGVGRATFYRIFDNIYDVFLWKCDDDISTMLSSYAEKKKDSDNSTDNYELLKYFFEYWTENSLIAEQILKINRIDIIYNCLEKNSHLIYDCHREFFKDNDLNPVYFFALRSGFMLSILIAWLHEEKKESPSELVDIVAKQFDYITANPVLL